MEILSNVILALSPFAIIYGLILLIFISGKRKKGLIIFLVGIFILPVVAATFGGAFNAEKSEILLAEGQLIRQEDFSKSQEEISQSSRQKDIQSVLDASSNLEASTSSNPVSSTQIFSNESGLNLDIYCEWEDKSHAITLAANDRFGQSPSGDAFVQKRAWADERQEKLAAETASKLDVSYHEMLAIADQRYWTARCTAKREGYAVMDIAAAKRASKADGKAVSWPLKTVPLFGRDGGFDLWHGNGIRMRMF